MQTQISQTQAPIPALTVHGRFQPPIHVNHWAYIRAGFEMAQHLTLLITNPNNDEAFDASASWRNDPSNNPFSFEERAELFGKLFEAMGIGAGQFTIRPFNIKDPRSFEELDPRVPNLVNVYSEWSAKKVGLFAQHGLPVIQLNQPKLLPVSGTKLREIIRASPVSGEELGDQLIAAGLLPQALPGLLHLLQTKQG